MPQLETIVCDSEETAKTLSDAIIKISRAAQSLEKNGINRDCIVALIARKTNVSRVNIESVLNSLEQLEESYCTTTKLNTEK